MRYYIDTNILIYLLDNKSNLSKNTKSIFEDYEHQIHVSSETIKEFIHLFQQNRIKFDLKKADNIFEYIEQWGYTIKYIKKEHLKTFANLPIVKNHKDPSDRLIIAQSITEKIPLISSDTDFPLYREYGLDLIEN
ncbi:MAG: type II toxin-antitoxin system VapC family toxin [Lentimicrobiaceae bacterium]|nr:type II toxin-antitoxin system VapC family toxin [Lentimicrobiaceae bacterium]